MKAMSKQEKPAREEARPVRDKDGAIILYDLYFNGEWIGSKRTPKQCEDRFKFLRHEH